MSFKEKRLREKFRKKARRGFRGYPVATVVHYGPTDKRASKVVTSIVKAEDAGAEPMRKWFSETGDVRTDLNIREEILRFIGHGIYFT